MIAATLALHGVPAGAFRVRSWLELVQCFAAERELTLNWMGIQAEDYPQGLITFSEGEQVLSAVDLERVQAVEVYSSQRRPGATIFNWELTSCINRHDASLVLCCAINKFALDECFGRVALRFSDCIDTRYGYGFERTLAKGPNLYALGISTGLSDSEADWKEADAIGKWLWEGIDGRAFVAGRMRDVYPINILSDSHVTAKAVTGLSLADWVSQDVRRGVIECLRGGLWLWRVEARAIVEIRRSLQASGLIVCC